MKKRLFVIIPALLGLFLSSCRVAASTDASSSSKNDDGATTQSSSSDDTVQYTITFKDELDNVLESKKWDEGSTPSYRYQKDDTAEWDYTFHGWATSLGGEVITIPAVTEDATYWAVVSKEKQTYVITFYDENGQQIQSNSLEYGAQPSCDYTGPDDTAELDYTFIGWSDTRGGQALASIPKVNKTANYYAVVNKAKQKYLVTFYDEEGNELKPITYEYGAIPSYTYVKEDTQEWDYTVKGWAASLGGTLLNKLPNVTGPASYYAVVDKVKQKYSIEFDCKGGTTVPLITAEYGTVVQEPTKPTMDNHKFVAWSYDEAGSNKVTWPVTLVKNEKFYANWNEVINIKAYLQALIAALGQDPYSYIPDTMRPENSDNHVTASQMNYNFTNFTNVSDIKYGGFGEQWHMVMENLKESERFYSVIALCETVINASVVLFNNYLDNNPSDTASHTLNETEYTAKLNYSNGLLTYDLQYKTGLDIPFFGEILPVINMSYDVTNKVKEVRVNLTENNAMKYSVSDNSYIFGLEYGVTAVSRKAYFEINRDEETEEIDGHIFEYVQYKDKDLVPACADFYIADDYTSVVGNKASGIPGFSGYINELYLTEQGKLLGYEIRETFEKWGIEATYHTLWFNLNDISGINNVKAIKNEESTYGLGGNNNHNIYLNNSDSIFEPTYNKKLLVSTSRKYDVELRKQYFYGYNEGQFTEYEVSIPMMFIQADHDGYTNFSDFPNDIYSKSGITARVTLSQRYLAKIQADYASLIDIFIRNKDNMPTASIEAFIGSVRPIA